METESARSPLTPVQDDPLLPLGRRAQMWECLLGWLLIADFILEPATLMFAFGLNLQALFESQAGQWSFASSMLDWIFVTMIRDVAMVVLLRQGRRQAEAEKKATMWRWLRRTAGGVFVYGIGRLSLLDWTPSDAPARFVPTFAISTFMTPALVLVAHLILKSWQSVDKQRAIQTRLASGGEEGAEGGSSDNNDQYSSKLTFFQTLKVLRPYFWPSTGEPMQVVMNRARAVGTWVCVAGSKICNIIAPIFLGRATNGVTAALASTVEDQPIPSEVAWDLVIYAFLIFLSKALKEAQSLVYIKVQQAAYIEIADATFAHLHSLSLDWHLRKKMGNVIRSMDRGIQAAQQTMQYVFLYLFPTLGEAMAVALVFVFHFKNLRLAVFMVINLYLYIYLTVQITLWRKRFRTATTKHDNELHDRLTDSLVNYETIKYFTAEEYERQQYRSVVEKFQKYSMATQASLSLLNVLQQMIINFTLAGGMILATLRLLQSPRGNLGEFVAVNAYILQTFAPLSFLGTIYNMVVNALVDMHSFGQLLAEAPDVCDETGAGALDLVPRPGTPMVEFKNIFFSYRRQPQERSIKDISFCTPRGGTTALVGTTGAGKTTITRLLFRFYDPVSGQVLINGQDSRSVTQTSLRQAIGFVPQDVVMFNSSIKHNIKYGRIQSASEADVEDSAKKAQLSDFVDQQADRYETVVGERGLKLSGGEKQRLAIARCLMKNPPIVVLDEATSALDSQTEQRIQQALDVLSSSRTVIAIAHRLSTIRDFDELLVLENGQIIERGKHDDLVALQGSKYAQMWEQQAKGGFDSAAASPETSEASKEPSAGVGFAKGDGHGSGHGGGHGGGYHGSGHGHGHGGHGF